ncbi:MAG: hypothetical protein AAFV53_25080 [Myxococcota bacterium]
MRVMLYDQTCMGQDGRLPLSAAWRAGDGLYQGLGWLDAARGVDTWRDGLAWLADQSPDEPIEEIQFWGHGKWGCALIDGQPLSLQSLSRRSPLRAPLEAVRARTAPAVRWWFRTCETVGASAGQDFARGWSDFFGGPVTGHTYIIGFWQSGLRTIRPGCEPDYAASEGLKEGTPAAPLRAFTSAPWRPRTVSCLNARVPKRW